MGQGHFQPPPNTSYMFDDQPIPQSQGNVPNNLPIGEVDDMFGATDAALPQEEGPLASSAPAPQTVGAMPSAIDAGILKPKQPAAGAAPQSGYAPTQPLNRPTVFQTPPVGMTGPEAGETFGRDALDVKPPIFGRGLIVTLIGLLILGGVGAGAWWAYGAFIQQPQAQQAETQNTAAPTTTEALPVEENTVADEINEQQRDNEIIFGEELDDDEDQLSNETEISIGTNPTVGDTDQDGLSDGDEVLIWNTNPLSSDTDSDSYMDGTEVKAGFDPRGPGRLFSLPATSTSATSTTSTR